LYSSWTRKPVGTEDEKKAIVSGGIGVLSVANTFVVAGKGVEPSSAKEVYAGKRHQLQKGPVTELAVLWYKSDGLTHVAASEQQK